MLPTHPSCVWRFAAVFPLLELARSQSWLVKMQRRAPAISSTLASLGLITLMFFLLSCRGRGGGGGVGGRSCWAAAPLRSYSLDPSFRRGSCSSRTRRGTPCSSSITASIVGMEKCWRGHGGLVAADGIRGRTRRCLWKTYGASRPPESSDAPPYSLAEGRPMNFLPARKPKGRQLCSCSESMAWCHGACAGPSGLVPGVGDKFSVEEQIRTRSHFLSSVRGPFRIVQGLLCNISFLSGLELVCNCRFI